MQIQMSSQRCEEGDHKQSRILGICCGTNEISSVTILNTKKHTLIVGSLPASAKVYNTLATIPYRHRAYSAVERVNRFVQKYCTSRVHVTA